MPIASIVIPVFGRQVLLDNCLKALRANTEDYELILVDNGTGHHIDDASDIHALIRNHVNIGFAAGCNQGARSATGDVVVLLNVDTEVHEGWLPPLLAAFDDPEVGMAGSKLVYPDGSIQHAGIEFSYGPKISARNIHEERPAGDVEGVTGACLAIRQSVFFKVGCLDESFWNGNEDVDLCLTVRDHGYRIRYVPESVVTHHESATGPERWTAVQQNISRLAEKWGAKCLTP